MAVASLISGVTACNSGTSGGPEPTTTTSTTSTEAEPLTGFLEPTSGTEGKVTYQADLPQVRGGEPAVRDKFNADMKAALDKYLQPTEDNRSVTVAPGALVDEVKSEVTHVGTGSVSGVLILNISVEQAAHPFNEVATTVIDARTADPINIATLFTDETVGLTALVDAIKTEMAADERLANQPPPDATPEALSRWVADDDGLEIYIPVAHVLGDYYEIGVEWDALAHVLAPGIRETLST
ncbi:hypothetical protein CQY22_015560 [Mycolicibacterium brumae]|uniref:DUF3298 domain-containing protein n=1 Tax=Mycolicibacterium brumae TaxID=85968 RepID=A0A2G5P7C8_9MYCO|nr:hypothetical protein CQY22_015560 [Mycolicibacterium brumae]RWA19915.1 hypothetical protein MBRU_15980 [Mycolicibacterium brumae DSM 44177]